jgi:hypothetical protein
VTDLELVRHLLGPDHWLMPSDLIPMKPADYYPTVAGVPANARCDDRRWLDATHITHHGCPYAPKAAHDGP